ncbi:hypothetical protein QBC36DRAFT_377708 [Triangularia setosa]|uniref:Heterokaryon incompatibility domain-containing protein n=1 Tax=Triangularia setosa TaxID=2587417 RepID=A0AAN7A8V7_9PEZI|nr:hypothetical protein QBC36DRAFT_377708 [Podospora setosa]
MARWHKANYSHPLVKVGQTIKTSYCTSCGASPNLDELAAALPDDDNELKTSPSTSMSRIDTYTTGLPPTKTEPEPINPSSLLIYGRALQPDEFRFLHLSFAEPDYLIHITIELCQDDHYSSYETCSYSWGGEDGHSTLCKPVYLGKYWDILF